MPAGYNKKMVLKEYSALFTRHLWIYALLAAGFILKDVGSLLDVSYHFKHLRDFYQLPHVVNGVGDIIVLLVFVYLWLTEPKKQRGYLKIILGGILVFFFGIVFDQWWHQAYGVDLTIWSPAHVTLYLGTLICLIGSLLYVARDSKHAGISERLRRIYCLIFFTLILSAFWFLLVQQEQGVVADYFMKRGVRVADSELALAYFLNHKDVYAGIPFWVYGAWASLSVTLVFSLVKRLDMRRWSASIIATAYVVMRAVVNCVFIVINYQTSTVPYYLIIVALLFDFTSNIFSPRPVLGKVIPAVVIVLGFLSVGLVETSIPMHPQIPLMETLVAAVPAAVMGYAIASMSYRSLFKKHL